MVDQTQTQTPTQDVIEISLRSGSYSNTFHHEVLYSLKRSKFVKGHAHKGASWGVDYRILPGYYILFSAGGYKDVRGFGISIEKVRIYKDETGDERIERLETICEVDKLTREDVEQMTQDPRAPESLKLFLECIPWSYHTVGCVPDPNKTFSPDEIQKVCQYLRTKMVETAED